MHGACCLDHLCLPQGKACIYMDDRDGEDNTQGHGENDYEY